MQEIIKRIMLGFLAMLILIISMCSILAIIYLVLHIDSLLLLYISATVILMYSIGNILLEKD